MRLTYCLLLAYIFGGIPFGLIIAKLSRGVDIRRLGSGNIGATNVLRVVGWKAGLVVLLLDAAKGFLPVWLAQHLALQPLGLVLTGLAAILGHTFSPFLRFTGGRGVATGLGVMLALSWKAGVCGFLLAVAIIAVFRYVSLGSVIGAASLPFLVIFFRQPRAYVIFTALTAALVIARHVPNIRRLLAGTEAKIGQRSSEFRVQSSEGKTSPTLNSQPSTLNSQLSTKEDS